MRIFEHNFVADKAKIRRRAVARQEFLTQSAAKFAEKTCAYACEDRFLFVAFVGIAQQLKWDLTELKYGNPTKLIVWDILAAPIVIYEIVKAKRNS